MMMTMTLVHHLVLYRIQLLPNKLLKLVPKKRSVLLIIQSVTPMAQPFTTMMSVQMLMAFKTVSTYRQTIQL